MLAFGAGEGGGGLCSSDHLVVQCSKVVCRGTECGADEYLSI